MYKNYNKKLYIILKIMNITWQSLTEMIGNSIINKQRAG